MTVADNARKIPGVAAAERVLTGVFVSEQDLPIIDYDEQTAQGIAAKLEGVIFEIRVQPVAPLWVHDVEKQENRMSDP